MCEDIVHMQKFTWYFTDVYMIRTFIFKCQMFLAPTD